jgi:dCTP deaminase
MPTIFNEHYGILSGKFIHESFLKGDILIEPFNVEQLNPASYDLTLGENLKVYEAVNYFHDVDHPCKCYIKPLGSALNYLDSKKENLTKSFEIPNEGWILHPGIGYLMHTQEKVGTKKYVPVVDGKSSIGRLFIQIHATAGYGDPNFFGQYTLEVIVQHPVKVYKGMRFAQIRFHTIVGDVPLYNGNYVGNDAIGAVASKSWKQFK